MYINREFPGGPVVRTPHFHCRRHGLDSWLGNEDAMWLGQKKKKNVYLNNGYPCVLSA